jgi:hypothetical protein
LTALDAEKVVQVAISGNFATGTIHEPTGTIFLPPRPWVDRYPQLFGTDNTLSTLRKKDNPNEFGRVLPAIKNMIVVGATNFQGAVWPDTQFSDFLTTYAPGDPVAVPSNGLAGSPPWYHVSGTSFGEFRT